MEKTTQDEIVRCWKARPNDIRRPRASEIELTAFESRFGSIPKDHRWFLAECGGGVVGSEWVDDITVLGASHEKFQRERLAAGWKSSIFIIGWNGTGCPLGIDRDSGAVVIEPEGSGGALQHPRSNDRSLPCLPGLLVEFTLMAASGQVFLVRTRLRTRGNCL